MAAGTRLATLNYQHQPHLDSIDTILIALVDSTSALRRGCTTIASSLAESKLLLQEILNLLPPLTNPEQSHEEHGGIVYTVFDEMLKTTSDATCVFGLGENDGSELVTAVSASHALVDAEVFVAMPRRVHAVTTEIEPIREARYVEDKVFWEHSNDVSDVSIETVFPSRDNYAADKARNSPDKLPNELRTGYIMGMPDPFPDFDDPYGFRLLLMSSRMNDTFCVTFIEKIQQFPIRYPTPCISPAPTIFIGIDGGFAMTGSMAIALNELTYDVATVGALAIGISSLICIIACSILDETGSLINSTEESVALGSGGFPGNYFWILFLDIPHQADEVQLHQPHPAAAPMLNLLVSSIDNKPVISLLAVLNSHTTKTGSTWTRQLLVQWNGLPLEDTSWKSLDAFRHLYPTFNLEDKVAFDEVGNDKNESNDKNGTNSANRRPIRIRNQPKKLDDYVSS